MLVAVVADSSDWKRQTYYYIRVIIWKKYILPQAMRSRSPGAIFSSMQRCRCRGQCRRTPAPGPGSRSRTLRPARGGRSTQGACEMAGNSKRKGAIKKTGKGNPTAGSGGRVRRGLEGRGPTPKASHLIKRAAPHPTTWCARRPR